MRSCEGDDDVKRREGGKAKVDKIEPYAMRAVAVPANVGAVCNRTPRFHHHKTAGAGRISKPGISLPPVYPLQIGFDRRKRVREMVCSRYDKIRP